jgi:hypothetical protein
MMGCIIGPVVVNGDEWGMYLGDTCTMNMRRAGQDPLERREWEWRRRGSYEE